jgi:hypothetical protein
MTTYSDTTSPTCTCLLRRRSCARHTRLPPRSTWPAAPAAAPPAPGCGGASPTPRTPPDGSWPPPGHPRVDVLDVAYLQERHVEPEGRHPGVPQHSRTVLLLSTSGRCRSISRNDLSPAHTRTSLRVSTISAAVGAGSDRALPTRTTGPRAFPGNSCAPSPLRWVRPRRRTRRETESGPPQTPGARRPQSPVSKPGRTSGATFPGVAPQLAYLSYVTP